MLSQLQQLTQPSSRKLSPTLSIYYKLSWKTKSNTLTSVEILASKSLHYVKDMHSNEYNRLIPSFKYPCHIKTYLHPTQFSCPSHGPLRSWSIASYPLISSPKLYHLAMWWSLIDPYWFLLDGVSGTLERHEVDVRRSSLCSSFMDSLCRVRNWITHVLLWRTIYALVCVNCWC